MATATAWPASRVRRLSRRVSLSVGGGIPGRNTTTLAVLIETESHGTWAPTEVPAPSGLMNAKDIVCPKVSACVGIGLSDPDGGPAEAAIEQPGS